MSQTVHVVSTLDAATRRVSNSAQSNDVMAELNSLLMLPLSSDLSSIRSSWISQMRWSKIRRLLVVKSEVDGLNWDEFDLVAVLFHEASYGEAGRLVMAD
ncbi:hypothetical protein M0R45_029867 [Rubus argutus]|uniref:Uncharacterized protein n=1 Tax=Rubus argutus TaxID=59490 RepID=A0AAW1WBS9_RUBAR